MPMPFETERVISDTPPTVDQLQTLASIGIASAIERKKFRHHARMQSTHYFIDELDRTEFTLDEEYMPVHIRHRMAALVRARPPVKGTPKTWSLKYFNSYYARSLSGESAGSWLGERSTYRFEWNRNGVLMADRAIRLTGFDTYGIENDDLEYALDHFRIANDAAAMLNVSEELRMITEQDCEELIKDMSDYFLTADAVAQR